MFEKLFQSIETIGSPVLEVQIQALYTFNYSIIFCKVFGYIYFFSVSRRD